VSVRWRTQGLLNSTTLDPDYLALRASALGIVAIATCKQVIKQGPIEAWFSSGISSPGASEQS
jgi:hypothetical protein